MQVLEEEVDYIIRIEKRKRRRLKAPGSSKRKHSERADQKRRRGDLTWIPNPEQDPHPKVEPQSHEAKRRDQPKPEPHVETPRPDGWKPLVPTPKILRTQEDVMREANKKLAGSGKDQEKYMKREHVLMEKKREEDKKSKLLSKAPPPKIPAIEAMDLTCPIMSYCASRLHLLTTTITWSSHQTTGESADFNALFTRTSFSAMLIIRRQCSDQQSPLMIPFPWSVSQGVASRTKAHACAWQACQPVLSDP
jgi:hypothetical protein